jgi:hypothetical protein
MNIDIIYIKDLKRMLCYSDTRSVLDYCERNNISILGQGKRRYVLTQSFKRAQLSERITHLKESLGEGWINSLQSEISLCAKLESALDEIDKDKAKHAVKQRPITKSKAEQDFLNEIHSMLLDNI